MVTIRYWLQVDKRNARITTFGRQLGVRCVVKGMVQLRTPVMVVWKNNKINRRKLRGYLVLGTTPNGGPVL